MIMDLGQSHLLKRRWVLLWGYEIKVNSSLRESTLLLSIANWMHVSCHQYPAILPFNILKVVLLSCKVVPTALLGSAVADYVEVVIHKTVFRSLGLDAGCVDDVPPPLVQE